jgi:hypothetical protein
MPPLSPLDAVGPPSGILQQPYGAVRQYTQAYELPDPWVASHSALVVESSKRPVVSHEMAVRLFGEEVIMKEINYYVHLVYVHLKTELDKGYFSYLKIEKKLPHGI